MLFEPTTGADELKSLVGFLYNSNSFENIATDVAIAEEEITEVVGEDVMKLANDHYDSENFGQGGEDFKLLDDLVRHIQLPVAYQAVAAYAAHTDVSHGEDGRKVVIDNENQKMAWQWMLDKDDEAMISKAHKTTDRLLAFLERHVNELKVEIPPEEEGEDPEYKYVWRDSEKRKEAMSLLISTPKMFNDIFPIDNSRRFYLTIVPFIKEAERKHLLPVLGATLYKEIKDALISEEGYADTKGILIQARIALAYFTLNIAVRRLAIRILPNGIFQDYVSERMDRNARTPAAAKDRAALIASLRQDADHELDNLAKIMTKKKIEELALIYEPRSPIAHIKSDGNIMRL